MESTSLFLICRIENIFIAMTEMVRNRAYQVCWIPFEMASASVWRQEKKCKLLLLFLPLLCLWCVFISTEINGRDKHGHQPWLRFSAHGRHSYRGLPSKGSPILVFVNGGSLNEIPPKHEILHVQQLNGIASVVYIWLYDIFRLYALAEIYIVLDGLFFQLKYAANNVLTYECYFLYW